jgi:beta-xylosidase
MNEYLTNGSIWTDTDGNVIHAHGGHIIFHSGTYYWYGENRTDNNYVSVYSSSDLMNWRFENNVLTVSSQTASHRIRTNTMLTNEQGGKINIERPKVIYNKKSSKFIMWMHVENGINYDLAACGIAISDNPTGNFTYLGCFNPYGYMSRDCTLFVDDDETAYFISSSRDNADMHVYRLTDDYLNVDKLVNKLWQGEYREAPAVVKKDGVYYMLSSYCTGWDPNQCKYASAPSIVGKWSTLSCVGDSTTYRTQPAFILQTETGNIYYYSDRWNGDDYDDSRYVILPLIIDDNNVVHLDYQDTITIK